MREIKFRGMATVTKKWVYGYYCRMGGGHFIISDDSYIDQTEVIPETVGQFIGEKDFWEDDIVKISRMNVDGSMRVVGIGQIVFDQARFYVKFSNGKCSSNLFNDIEKLGDIHSNPELLEEQAK